jgi:hypothetical protein
MAVGKPQKRSALTSPRSNTHLRAPATTAPQKIDAASESDTSATYFLIRLKYRCLGGCSSYLFNFTPMF